MKAILCLTLMLCLHLQNSFPQAPTRGDIVINEVLFNPSKEGYDYIEGYNKSEDTIDLRGLVIANRNAAGDIASEKPVSHDSTHLPPGAYFVITSNEKWLRQHYHIPQSAIICQVSAMPSFPDDEGTVIFLNSQDSIIDELAYNSKWHFSLLTDPSGIALERISYDLPTQNRSNWTSASSSSGYGTPGYKNSQFRDGLDIDDEIVVPHLFSPDNDGINDIELIQFKMKEPGFVANTTIYDLSGRKVRYLIKNETPGLSAIYKWDGLDEKSQPIPAGIYILVTEMFNLNGTTKRFKNAVTLARK
ncbi:MAG: lamin tail domain-containing protein [Chitinophagaceae bacterium]|nr:lamin tail domain-containing protein [Chitinophagaceae bacterium]